MAEIDVIQWLKDRGAGMPGGAPGLQPSPLHIHIDGYSIPTPFFNLDGSRYNVTVDPVDQYVDVPGISWNDVCDSLGRGLDAAGISRRITVPDSVSPPGASGGGDAGAPAIPEPNEVLEKIVRAINQAEGILNQQNLVIAAGSVQASLNVSVAGVVAAQATIQLNIQPKPYS